MNPQGPFYQDSASRANLKVTLIAITHATAQRPGVVSPGPRLCWACPTLQFWHIPPMKRGCSKVTLRLPQEMQMSGEQRKQSVIEGAPSHLGPKPGSRKEGRKASGRGPMEQGGHAAPSQEPTHLPEQRCRLPGKACYEDKRLPARTGPTPGHSGDVPEQPVLRAWDPDPILPSPEGPELDTPSLGKGRQTWEALMTTR